jgi:hypothetical protein
VVYGLIAVLDGGGCGDGVQFGAGLGSFFDLPAVFVGERVATADPYGMTTKDRQQQKSRQQRGWLVELFRGGGFCSPLGGEFFVG